MTSDEQEKGASAPAHAPSASTKDVRRDRASGPSLVTGHPSPRDSSPFCIPVRIYWEDTDAGGIVYYANYFKFMERARTDWLRSLGVEQEAFRQEHGRLFVVVDVEAHFRRPARYGELLQVTCEVAQASAVTLTFRQEIFRGELGGELLLDGRVRVACLDAKSFRPRPLPDWLLQEKGE